MERILTFLDTHALGMLVILALLFVVECTIRMFLNKKGAAGNLVDGQTSVFEKELSKNGRDIYVLMDIETHMPIYVSEHTDETLGIPSGQISSDPTVLYQLIDPNTKRQFQKDMSEWDKKNSFMAEYAYKRAGEDENLWGSVYVTKTKDQKFYMYIFSDKTKEKAVRDELLEELSLAHKVDESKTLFLSKMSHEIRTPMNGMLGMLSLARISAAGGKLDELEDYLEKAESLSQFLLSIINDILDMTRIESGKMELEAVQFDLFAMFANIRSMFQTTIEGKGVHFKMDILNFTTQYVIGDELRITQVINNLLSNASKFTDPGGSITVTFKQMDSRDDKMSLMMRVKDTGKGMSSTFLHRLFKPFEQEDSGIARRYGGSGLGMSISDNLIKMMNGQILVDSEEGKGTEFTVFIELPIAADVKIKKQITKPEVTLEGRRFLMAEDNDMNILVTTRLLTRKGMTIEVAKNGQIALDMFTEHPAGYYDAILMDIHMPVMDGWEATKALRAMERPDAKTIPVFALSADAFVEDKRHSVEIGMNGHIAKPIDYKELEQTLREAL